MENLALGGLRINDMARFVKWKYMPPKKRVKVTVNTKKRPVVTMTAAFLKALLAVSTYSRSSICVDCAVKSSGVSC